MSYKQYYQVPNILVTQSKKKKTDNVGQVGDSAGFETGNRVVLNLLKRSMIQCCMRTDIFWQCIC